LSDIFTWLDGNALFCFNCHSDRTRDIASVLGLPDKPMDVEVAKHLMSSAFASSRVTFSIVKSPTHHDHVTMQLRIPLQCYLPSPTDDHVLAEWFSQKVSSYPIRRCTNHAADVDTGHHIFISLIKSASLCLSTPLSFGLPSACPPASTVLIIKSRQQSYSLSFEFCTLSNKPQCRTCIRIKRINELRAEHSRKKVIVH